MRNTNNIFHQLGIEKVCSRYFFVTVRYLDFYYEPQFINLVIPTNGIHFTIDQCIDTLTQMGLKPKKLAVTFYN